MGKANRNKRPPGFMVYVEDWKDFAAQSTDKDMGQVVRALIKYFETGTKENFVNSASRLFYLQTIRTLDRDREKYADRCLQNSYNRLKQEWMKKGEEIPSYEEWASNASNYVTIVDDR